MLFFLLLFLGQIALAGDVDMSDLEKWIAFHNSNKLGTSSELQGVLGTASQLEPPLMSGRPAERADGPETKIDTVLVGTVLQGEADQFRICHEQALERMPDLEGTLMVTIMINERGRVSAASDGMNAELRMCAEARIATMYFGVPSSPPFVGIFGIPFTLPALQEEDFAEEKTRAEEAETEEYDPLQDLVDDLAF